MQKRTWPISSHLDRTSLVDNPYMDGVFVDALLVLVFDKKIMFLEVER